jgi:hypothetical protein
MVLAGLLLSCGGPAGPVPEVEYSDCWAVYLPGPVCVLRSDSKLRLWVKTDPRSEVEIRAGERHLAVKGEEAGEGRRFVLSLPPGSSPLTVRLRQPDGTPSAPWSLTLASPEEPPWFAEVLKLFQSGKQGELRQLLEDLQKVAPPRERSLVLRSLVQLVDPKDQAALLTAGIAVDQTANCLSGEIDKTTSLARIYILEGRFNEARQRLAALDIPAQTPAVSKFQVAYYQGLLAERTGDFRTALDQLESARALEERIDIPSFRGDAEQLLAGVYQSLGRTKEALDIFTRVRARYQFDVPCDLASLLTNEAWAQLRARAAGEQTPDPLPALQQAQKIFDEKGCARPDQRLNAWLNLAFAYQQTEQWGEARQALDQARRLKTPPNLNERLWRDNLEARAAIAEGEPERALQIYEDLDRMATAVLSPEGRLQASLGLAKARIALGQPDSAIDALAEADRRIDEQIWQIPAHEGRDTFLGQREEATRLYLQLLLDDGQRQRAFALARRARSRLLHRLSVRDRLNQLTTAERRKWDDLLSEYSTPRNAVDRQAAEEWQLVPDERKRSQQDRKAQLARAQGALDQALAFLGDPGKGSLSPPGPGEVILAYHPLSKDRWVGFAATVRGVETATFELPPGGFDAPEGLARKLLEPFRSAIEASERVRVLPYGLLRGVEFHALPFAGEPLFAHRRVVYSLDLPVRAPAPADGKLVALLVSDPLGNLAGAREEAEAVAEAVGAWGSGWRLERLGGLEAEAGAVLKALPTASFFHYAGHGTFAGFAGWDSSLPLANNSRLALGDLLTLSRVPQWVVLSACDAGHSSEQAPGEGIGLANAFLLAGAQTVIASTQEVKDDTARDLLSELYRHWKPGEDLARQFQRAQLACWRQDPKSGCVRFRLLEP